MKKIKILLTCMIGGIILLSGCSHKTDDQRATYEITDVNENGSETIGTVLVKVPDLQATYDEIKNNFENIDSNEVLKKIKKEMKNHTIDKEIEILVCKDKKGKWIPVSEQEIMEFVYKQVNEDFAEILSEMDLVKLSVELKEVEE